MNNMNNNNDILDINLDELEDVAVLDGNGVLRAGYKLISPKKDSSGLVRVVDSMEKVSQVHPSRVVKSSECSSVSTECDGKKVASCPECGAIAAINDDCDNATCNVCNRIFSVCIQGTNIQGEPVNISSKKRKPAKSNKKQEADIVDLNELASKGELWLRRDIHFDDPNTNVIVASFRIGEYYTSFNLYNMTFGKRGNKPPIDKLEGGINPDEKPAGVYAVKSVSKWRGKLKKKGYLRHEA